MESPQAHETGGRHNKAEPVVENKRSLAHAVRTLDPPITLVDRAREIEESEELVQSHVHGKLDVIVKQIRALKEQARDIIDQSRRDMELHRIKCNFEKRVGQNMYLYRKPAGDDGEEGASYFSMLSPADWGGSPPHEFLGGYRLNGDRSFEEIKDEDGGP